MTEEAMIISAGVRGSTTIFSGACFRCNEIFFSLVHSKGYCSRECADAHRKGAPTRKITRMGYVMISQNYSHPGAYHNGNMFEHTLIMEKHLGRYLRKGENIHHKNGLKDDNRIENLELWVSYQPHGQRVEDLIDFVARSYEKEVRLKLENNSRQHNKEI